MPWQGAGQKRVSLLVDVALGGLYIRTPEPPSPGASIQLLLDAPAGEVRARAVVQRTNPAQGIAVIIAMQHEARADTLSGSTRK